KTHPSSFLRAPGNGLPPRTGAPAFCRLTPFEHSKPAGCRRSGQPGASHCGYLLIEALVYIGVVAALLGVAYAAAYRSIDRSIALRRSADDITSALHAGERWRA